MDVKSFAPNVSVRVQETEREAPRGTMSQVFASAPNVLPEISHAEGVDGKSLVDGVEEEEEDGAAD